MELLRSRQTLTFDVSQAFHNGAEYLHLKPNFNCFYTPTISREFFLTKSDEFLVELITDQIKLGCDVTIWYEIMHCQITQKIRKTKEAIPKIDLVRIYQGQRDVNLVRNSTWFKIRPNCLIVFASLGTQNQRSKA